jgi:hypothetical protein
MTEEQEFCDVCERPITNADTVCCPHCGTKWATPFPGKAAVAPPLTAGPVATPPDLGTLLDDLTWLLGIVEQDLRSHHLRRSDPFNICLSPMCVRYREIRDREKALKVGEAQRGAARPPQPQEIDHGTGLALPALRETDRETDPDAAERGRVDADAVSGAEHDGSPPTRQPARAGGVDSESRQSLWGGKKQSTGRSPDKKACADELERALAVPPEAPPR